MARLRYNGLRTTLGASLTNVATTITFPAALTSLGNNVPTLVAPDYIPLCLNSPTTGLVTEIVYLTAYTSGATTGTISRGVESTAIAHNNGDPVACDATAADFGVVTSYAPVWGVATGSTGLGTGGSAVGLYSLHGPLCYFTLTITLGTSGFANGTSGQYSLTLPLTPSRDATLFGSLRMGGNPYVFVADVTNASTTIAPKVLPTTAGGPTLNWQPTTPTAPVASSVWRCSGTYFWAG